MGMGARLAEEMDRQEREEYGLSVNLVNGMIKVDIARRNLNNTGFKNGKSVHEVKKPGCVETHREEEQSVLSIMGVGG